MIKVATMSMANVIGPQSSLSGREGVIQFAKAEAACTPKAVQLVQVGQSGDQPAAEVIAKAIPNRTNTDAPAAIRPVAGSLPWFFPPWVMGPHGAPKISAN